MNFTEFMETIVQELKNRLMGLADVEEVTARKNNNVVLHGVTLRERGKKVSPSIYLENFYEAYTEGAKIAELADRIIQIYEDRKDMVTESLDFFSDFHQVRHRIVFKVINYKKNRQLLRDTPHIPYLDLAMVFYCIVETSEIGEGSILIKEEHIKNWGTDLETVYKNALENTPRILPEKIYSMDKLLEELAGEEGDEEEVGFEGLEGAESQLQYGMVVLTNSRKCFGAACLLYPQLLERYAEEIKNNLYVLPSSVHEVILLPEVRKDAYKELSEMVREVNRTQLEEEEILADSVYYYDRSRKSLELLT